VIRGRKEGRKGIHQLALPKKYRCPWRSALVLSGEKGQKGKSPSPTPGGRSRGIMKTKKELVNSLTLGPESTDSYEEKGRDVTRGGKVKSPAYLFVMEQKGGPPDQRKRR